MEFLIYQPKGTDTDWERISRLRMRMEKRSASICSERALLYTESFRTTEGEPYILRKAKAFAHTLKHMTIYIEKDSLIFGNQASRCFAAPVFPEYSIDWVIRELDEFELRDGDVFHVDESVKKDLRSIHAYWHGHTHEDRVNAHLTETLRLAEKQGILHRGGISMSGDGHIVPDYPTILNRGFRALIHDAEAALNGELSKEQRWFYESVICSLEASLAWFRRYGALLKKEADACVDEKRKKELLELSEMASSMMEQPARSFHEGAEVCYLVHILQMIESNGHSFCYGRFDQYLYDLYRKDKENGVLDDDRALEIITHLFIMNSSANKVRPYGHTRFSQGYPLYSNLCVGGYKPDGSDGTNELSCLCIEAMHLCSLAEPNFSARFNKNTPKEFLTACAQLIRTGCGMPSMFNDDTAAAGLMDLGIPEEDALDYCPIGCVETGVPGKYGHRATGMTYVNWGKVLETMLYNGFDPKTGIRLLKVNDSSDMESRFSSFDEVWKTWERFLKYYSDLAVECDRICDESLEIFDADPFASAFVLDSMKLGKTLKAGGCRYDVISQSNIGPSVVGNSLLVLKQLVFEERKLTFRQLMDAIRDNWTSPESRQILRMVKAVPKFGNDLDDADLMTAAVFDSYLKLLPDYVTARNGKGPVVSCYTMSTSNITSYVPNGLAVGATPDGRSAGSPLNEGCSPVQGTDVNGPTAVINSVSRLPNRRVAAGQLLNMRFSPDALASSQDLEKFVSFLRVSRKKGIYHNQFNVVSSKTLQEARKHPEQYTGLIVRVAGYCAQYVSLMPETQEAIIARTENSWT